MKKIFFILIIAFTSGITSCKKFLKEENPSGITAENYYTTTAGFESLVNSCYATLKGIYNINPSLFEWGTDITTRGEIQLASGTANDITGIQLNEYKSLSPDNEAVAAFFTAAYAGIQRCNTAINKAGGIPDLTEALRKKRTAEVRFIRAYFYYLLVENFGNVPLVTDELTSPVTHFVPNTEQEVYEFMFKELNEFLPNLEADPSKAEFGRVTQAAAKHLLSLLHLTRGYKTFAVSTDFQKSAQFAEELISSPYYTLLPSFADVFKVGNEKNKEIIFSVQYEPGQIGSGNGQNIMWGWAYYRDKGFDEVTGLKDYNRRRSDFMPTQFFYTLYNSTKDSRYDGSLLSQLRATKDDGVIKKGDLRFYFPYPDQPFTSADSTALKTANPNVEIIRFEKWKQAFNNVGGLEKFPMIIKFYDPNSGLPGSNENFWAGVKDVFLFRIAETYLIAAEAYFKAGQLDKAAEKLNAVRGRAAKAGQSLSINAIDVTLDFILDERAREMAGEYKRWLDLKRTRKLARAFQNNNLTQMTNPGVTEAQITKYYLRPIPQSVIDRDTKGYPQNSGY